jgi:two-component system response regulator VicR
VPDVIICDLMMPDIGGIELLRALHANPETEGIPFIVLSALNSDDDKVAAFELGADDYVTKPYSFKELQARVQAKIKRPPVPVRYLRKIG